MNDFWTGFLALPAAVVAVFATWCAVRWLLSLAGKAMANFSLRLPSKATSRQRATMASVIYGASRGRMVTLGEFAFVVLVGQDGDRQKKAYESLVGIDRLTLEDLFPEEKLRLLGRNREPVDIEEAAGVEASGAAQPDETGKSS